MDQGDGNGLLLPQELLAAQLGQIELLMAMYPAEGSVLLSDTASATLESLREAVADGFPPKFAPSSRDITLLLELEIKGDAQDDSPRPVQLSIAVPLYCNADAETLADPPPARVRLQQPPWMSKAQVRALMAALPREDADDLFATIENITAALSAHNPSTAAVAAAPPSKEAAVAAAAAAGEADTLLTRVWFYFPSISTREKRDDLVAHAPAYGLTGFLLAGKPGLLCVEGAPRDVDAYMRFVRTESWGDIPAHHKKVSERFRQPGIGSRAFADMREITGTLERRGERANRNDMRALEAWLAGRGLQEAFAKVLI